jgi:DNA-binding transcriptional LysR family regulator
MIEYFETLDALDRQSTTAAAGTILRISQSAVSKRIAALESRLGYAVIERRGRGVELTPAGRKLLIRIRPLLGEMRDVLLTQDEVHGPTTLTLGVSESILSSWGAGVLRLARDAVTGVHLDIHTHRSPVVVDRVRAGEYMLGLCAGIAGTATDLTVQQVAQERMVVIPSGLRPIRLHKGTGVITIEEHAATWPSIQRGVRAAGLEVEARVESFSAIARMAIDDLGHGLVPQGVADAVGLRPDQVQIPARGQIVRPISIIGRKSVISREPTTTFLEHLAAYSMQALA